MSSSPGSTNRQCPARRATWSPTSPTSTARELRRPGVTLHLLWEEYQQQHGGQAYKYSAFCEKYQAWARRLKRSMRQTHEAGDKLFVDYAGQTVPIVDASTNFFSSAIARL